MVMAELLQRRMRLKTDLDQLHQDKNPCIRRNGKTFDDCHTVAGLVGLGEETIVCVVPIWERISFIQPMLLSVLREMGYTLDKVSTREIWCENSRIILISESALKQGYHDAAFVEFKD